MSIRNLLERFFPSNVGEHKVVISGTDWAGKTTLLYYLKRGEIIQTIPTIGFNIEHLTLSTSSNQKLDLELWDLGSGCGGFRMARMMLRHIAYTAKAIIWVVDSTDTPEMMAESAETLLIALEDAEEMKNLKTERHLPVLILANKSDLPNAMPLDDIRKVFRHATAGRIASIYRTSLPVVTKSATGLQEAIDWLALALDIASSSPKTGGPAPKVELPPNPRQPSALSKRLETWLHQTEVDSPPDEFISQFKSYSLPSWDHYTHIRIAYLLLMAHGRQKGKDMVFSGLENYIANNSKTNVRGFHFTMTYFWIQIVHFGIRNMPPQLLDHPLETDTTANVRYPSSADFFRFLFINPHLVDGSLWTDYYSKEVMMSPEAKSSMVLPDKKPLPSLVIRDAIASFGTGS
ncbi:ADP-ribosylation factor [Coprinopsis cinerea AmutBmut pab1-1]|nr:ADP-ribosylation factor [Coprinopsis cinerea AmutBmut pab1-1]